MVGVEGLGFGTTEKRERGRRVVGRIKERRDYIGRRESLSWGPYLYDHTETLLVIKHTPKFVVQLKILTPILKEFTSHSVTYPITLHSGVNTFRLENLSLYSLIDQ